MKLNEGRPGAATLLIRNYGPDGITVGNDRHALPLLLTPTTADPTLPVRSLDELTDEHVERIAQFGASIVLAASAAGGRLPPAAVRRAFEARGIALEAMDLGAACRTYNVLAQEDRQVLALLLP